MPPDEKVLLEGVVHLDRVPVDVVQSKPALSILVSLEEVVHLDRVPLNVVPLEEVPPDVVQSKPALSTLVPLEKKVPLDLVHLEEEQCKRKLQQMEADSPAVIVIAYMWIIAKPGNGEGLWIGMDPLRGVFRTLEALV